MIPITENDLRNVTAFKNLPEDQLRWVLDRSTYEEYDDGGLVARFGEIADNMWVLLEGKVAFYMNLGGRQVYFFTFENDDVTGGVGGLMPYSRMKTIPGYAYAVGSTRLLRLRKDHFPDLEKMNPEFVQKLIGYMTERAKAFATTKLNHEKVSALGNLAAGIAHELNNPAAAINGISKELSKRLSRNYELTMDLLNCGLTEDKMQLIKKVVTEKEGKLISTPGRSALRKMHEQDELEDWLGSCGVKDRQVAETFSEFGFSVNDFESLRNILGSNVFCGVIPWLENLISSGRIISDLSDASGRISKLVTSIKSHVQMDRSNEREITDIHNDIENTLTLLGFKLREKKIEIRRSFFSDLPKIEAYVGELNQVWTNIIDNAIYAVEKEGRLNIQTGYDGKNVYVNFVDNGRGIPEEIKSRIFEPFFTTKKTGEGTGIGLDLVNRIITRHNGRIIVNSEPGRTEFTICLPVIQSQASA